MPVAVGGEDKEGVEVLDVAAHGDMLAAAQSSGEVALLSAAGGQLAPLGRLRGHPGPVTAVSFASATLVVSTE